MQFYYITICKRINIISISRYNEYFTSEEGRQHYIDFFNKNLLHEDYCWISDQGTAHINAHDMIVAD